MSEKAGILIVDDEKHMRDSISELLIDNGYSVRAAASGEEALIKLSDENFDIALVDVKMPKMSGMQLLKKIKTGYPRVDIIMITGYATIDMAVESLKLGAYDFLVKPCENARLLEALHRLVEKRTIEDKHKQAVEELRITTVRVKEESCKSEAIISALGDGLSIINTDFKITFQNHIQIVLTGNQEGIHCYKAYENRDRVCEECPLAMSFENGGIHKVVRNRVTKYLEITASPLRNADGKIIAGIEVFRDITECKQAEEKLREYSEKLEEMVEEQTRKLRESQALIIQTGKMAGLGTMAGGIAHEVNNPLGSILTYAQLIQSKFKKGTLSLDTAVDYATRIEEVAKHCKFTIQNLLDFSREPDGIANFFSVREAILASVSLLAHQMNLQGITVVNEAGNEAIFSYRNHLMQVLVNVLANAKDAMPDGGEIRIATSLEDNRVNISISDTGTGIKQEDMGKIFEPFFTTREPGLGTGLGLYLCYRIMENLGGKIDVKSVVDKGTTVTIKLPIKKH